MQPGDLDGDQAASREESAQATTTSTTSTTMEAGRGAGAQATTTTAAPTTTAPTTSALPGETTTTVAGSGLAVGSPPTGGTDGLADTGAESLLGPGLVLLALGLAGRRLSARTSTAPVQPERR